MKYRVAFVLLTAFLLCSCSGSTSDSDSGAYAEPAESPQSTEPAPDPAAQLEEMASACAAATDAIAQRQAQRSLYERLGRRDGIRAIMVEMIDVHMGNPTIKPLFDGVDMDRFIKNSTDFLSAGAGGPEQYTGGDVTAVHERLNITPELFLIAGADLEQAMQNRGVGPDEQQEVMCALVSLRGLVLPVPAVAQ